ncbi:MAG: magnesium/cobalt transporter CorA [Bacteroidales bacterium]|nr:magnesium/cobalt transporter CorA [Bacteroidales bacterium]
MNRQKFRPSRKIGLPPGSLVYTGDAFDTAVSITLMKYSPEEIRTHESNNIDEILNQLDHSYVNWINICGLSDTSIIEKTGNHFGLHPLLLEDILNTGHLPKTEEYEDHIFFTLKILNADNAAEGILQEHVSFVLGSYFLITYQEKKGGLFDSIRERILTATGKVRQRKSDYLMYLLMDKIVDHYFLIPGMIDDRNDTLEELVFTEGKNLPGGEVLSLRKQISFLRKQADQLTDAVSTIRKSENRLIEPVTLRYFNDIHDHLVEITQHLDTIRDKLTALWELNMANQSNRMNKIINQLTVIATIFIPLTFLVGIYGMNFEYMPELGWKWGYPLVIAIMVFLGTGMYIYIRRKRWM